MHITQKYIYNNKVENLPNYHRHHKAVRIQNKLYPKIHFAILSDVQSPGESNQEST